jgi:hypothetical protein
MGLEAFPARFRLLLRASRKRPESGRTVLALFLVHLLREGRVGQRYPRDYMFLLAASRPPQGTAAAAGGRPEHGRPDGGTGLGHQAPPGWPEYRRG